jgi:hypothetical protein
MIAATPSRRVALASGGTTQTSGEVLTLSGTSPETYWIEPETRQTYPTSYPAYRRIREAEDRRPPRHQSLGPHVDLCLARRWRAPVEPETNVRVILRPETPLRVRRIVRDILRAIRRGQPADAAIRHVSRQFGLQHTRAREFITACVQFEVQSLQEAVAPVAAGLSSVETPAVRM